MTSMHGRGTARLALAAGVLALAACDVPTALPRWDTTWVVPIDAMELSVASLLPAGMRVTPDRAAFELELDGLRIERRLGDLCAACASSGGALVPKPPFTARMGGATALPADVVSASVVGGEAQVEIVHDFGFDPIRPSATARGTIRVALLSAGDTLAEGVIDGEVEAFPPGTRKRLLLPLRRAEIRRSVRVSVVIDSPAGDPARLEPSLAIDVVLAPSTIRIAEVQASVQDRGVTLKTSTFEVGGGERFVDRIRSGALRLQVDNPFDVEGTFSLALSAPGVRVERRVALEPGRIEARVEFSNSELQSVLRGTIAALDASGTVSATGETVTIRPGQVLKAGSRFELVVATMER